MALFSNREIRGLMIFLPLAGLLMLFVWFAKLRPEPDIEQELTQEMECRVDSVQMFQFDPNSIEYGELRRLGLTQREAVSLLKYRATGKIFRIPEDVATCYGISDSLYFRLAPYIHIDRKYAIVPTKYKPQRIERTLLEPSIFIVDTVSATYLRAIGALSKRQAEAFVRWRDLRGIRDMEEFRECFVISDSVATALEPYVRFTLRPDPLRNPVELNSADSTALRSVNGIGPKSVMAIIRYRERLGGFHCVEQLTEIPEVTESNYERIVKQICCNSYDIQKIDINFAIPNVLSRHPYLSPRIIRKLLRIRQLKGGLTSTEEMVEENILTRKEAERLAPYLRFDVHESPNC